MINRRKQIEVFIVGLIEERCEYHDHQITKEDQQFLIATLTDFVHDSVDKFVRGDKQHNPDGESPFMSIDHGREMRNEIIDQLMYRAAEEYKKKHPQCTYPKTQ